MDADTIWRYCLRKHYSAGYAEYWTDHEVCEACDEKWASPPHHIRTRGAGGDDDKSNLLALCSDCHRWIHSMGKTKFCFIYPHLKAKIDAALDRRRT